MKYAKLVAVFSIVMAGFCAHWNAQAESTAEYWRRLWEREKKPFEKVGNFFEGPVKDVVTGAFSSHAGMYPDVCKFTNDSKASVWVNQIINGQPNAFTEIKSGSSMFIRGTFMVTRRNQNPKLNLPVAAGDAFIVDPYKDCKDHQLKFTELLKEQK